MPEIGRVRTVFTGVAGSPYYSNLYFLGLAIGADAQAAVDNVDVFWTSLASVMNIGLVGEIEAEVPVLDDTTGEIVSVFTTTGGVVDPTSADGALPWATQGLVRLATSGFIEGRRVRGRINIPGLGEASSDGGAPGTSIKASMQAAIDGLVDATDSTLVVWSRPKPVVPPTDPPTYDRLGSSYVVTSASVWDKWAQLRSRRD